MSIELRTSIAPATPDNWPPAMFAERKVAVAQLHLLGLPVATVEYASVGGGIGSFVWADMLRIAGAPVEQIAVVGAHTSPYGHYAYLTRNSQIPLHERIRSNSESTPDNIWGWPGYALREIGAELWQGHVGRAAGLCWQIFGEPALTDTYTPRIGDVFRAMEREAERIGWPEIIRYGRVRAIRQTDDGRYVIAYSRRGAAVDDGLPPHGLLVARHLHLATGYPTIRFLPELQRYREATGDSETVVNAYEPHEQIYQRLRRHGGLVLVQGRGIVASRILQRIYEERQHNAAIAIVHLVRSPIHTGHHYGRARRAVHNHVELQPFNWPRDCWTGKRRKLLERATPEERARLLEQWDGTTTARRHDWIDLIERGRREGWYQLAFGSIAQVERTPAGQLVTTVRASGQVTGELRYNTSFLIDATGLEADARSNPLLNDLVDTYGLQLNPRRRLHVAEDFEVPGMRNGTGRMYAAGAITLGGPNAGVDTFLGLQYAAWRAVDSLIAARAPGLRPIRGWRSVSQWLRWIRNARP
jgi:pSer/pThr/pTyr-binding forkhead associated (FHA) protein